MAGTRLIAGLGNPGPDYRNTPHNVGARWVEDLAERFAMPLTERARFRGRMYRGPLLGKDILLLAPSTYMNRSGESVAALAPYFRVEPAEILIVHDEVHLPLGITRLKIGGRRSTHNGLASVTASLGNRADFVRLRIGVGHPGRERMVGYLTGSRLSAGNQDLIRDSAAMDDALLQLVLDGEWQRAMSRLHAPRAEPGEAGAPEDADSNPPCGGE